MTWEHILLKEYSPIMEKTNNKVKKRIKKKLQISKPSEYMGQDFTKLSDLLDELDKINVEKSDKKQLQKLKDKNLSLVSKSAKLRKDYEKLYRELRDMIYPKNKGDLE